MDTEVFELVTTTVPAIPLPTDTTWWGISGLAVGIMAAIAGFLGLIAFLSLPGDRRAALCGWATVLVVGTALAVFSVLVIRDSFTPAGDDAVISQAVQAEGTIASAEVADDGQRTDVRLREDPERVMRFDGVEDQLLLADTDGQKLVALCLDYEDPGQLDDCEIREAPASAVHLPEVYERSVEPFTE